MDFLKDAWPWWVAGGLVAVVMHFAVKRAKLNLRPKQLVALGNRSNDKSESPHFHFFIVRLFGLFWW